MQKTLRSTAWDLVIIAECLRLASRPGDPPAVLRLTVRSLAEPADDPEDVERVDDLDPNQA